ncbi:MAG: hypothetical protein AB7N65_11075 [Vicinamibacterales bacterium]
MGARGGRLPRRRAPERTFVTWLLFAVVATVIVVAGVQLARYGDVIGEKSGLGRSWIGVVLLAATTSLPELFTGFGATALTPLPDIAVGDVLGSRMFNLLILSLMDAIQPDRISARASGPRACDRIRPGTGGRRGLRSSRRCVLASRRVGPPKRPDFDRPLLRGHPGHVHPREAAAREPTAAWRRRIPRMHTSASERRSSATARRPSSSWPRPCIYRCWARR